MNKITAYVINNVDCRTDATALIISATYKVRWGNLNSISFNQRKDLLTRGLSRTLKREWLKYWCGQLYCMDVRHGRCCKIKSTDCKHWRCGCGEDWKKISWSDKM